MTERKRTRREERSYTQLMMELDELETWLRQSRLKDRHIPDAWYHIERDMPARQKKVRITAAFDADVARWFRSYGPGYQARMNAVLRAYMLCVVSREIEGRASHDWKGDPI
ncbi:MAG: BrnA antitoxin family protein [Rhodobacteraceae bacterium]|uniref:BrnA antitoxin family protein n=1 Tax=Amaricoccus sp. B4 TaxID=3368557 RepID=UPI000DAEA307|nr:BrnA antitoxin family protein [Paracoccaceae bacterium]